VSGFGTEKALRKSIIALKVELSTPGVVKGRYTNRKTGSQTDMQTDRDIGVEI